MLSKSDTAIDLVANELQKYGVIAAYLVPTEVGLKKSTLDAHFELKKFLADNNFHNFDEQAKGQASKKILSINLVQLDEIKKSSISLYRPETKNGDPRFWISGLGSYANAYNLLAFIIKNGELFLVNVSNQDLFHSRLVNGSSLNSILGLTFKKDVLNIKIKDVEDKLNQENQFLQELLNLQQDGSESISAPSNWAKSEPLLKVETKLDFVINKFFAKIENSASNIDKIFWHFFIGSPGNGKSAAAGALARKLIGEGYYIVDEADNKLEDIPPSQIPYLLKVYKGDNKYASLWIAQDASVVKNPYAVDADPSKELINLINDAAKHEVSLVICTNRGVLEKASRAIIDKEVEKSPSFLAIRKALEGSAANELELKLGDLKKKIFLSSVNLEVQSLLFRSDIANNLIETATREKNWQICNSCVAKKICPFYNNRKWLFSVEGKNTLLALLRYVELLSGQLIVFREFLAFLSLLLAGSPIDYGDGTPCHWIHKKNSENNLFALAARRAYMLLFSSFAPSGLEDSPDVRRVQVKYIKDLLNESPDLPDQVRSAINSVMKSDVDNFVSTDVGIQRLLMKKGVFSKLDVNTAPLPSDFMGKWSIGSNKFDAVPEGLYSDLEKALVKVFNSLSSSIESSSVLSSKHYFWLSRWYTSFFFRLGSLVENRFALGTEVSKLSEVMNDLNEKQSDTEFLKRIEKIELTLNELLLGVGSGVRVSEYGRLKGKWVTEQLRPKIGDEESVSALGVPVNFGQKEKELLNAEAFSWLLRKVDTNMAMNGFPIHHLDSVQDALVRAASSSNYSVARDDVDLEISLPNSKHIVLRRFRGVVSAE